VATWSAEEPYDVVFSNAAIQWVPGHATLIPHLFRQVAPGGALAVQTPSHEYSTLHRRMQEIALHERWRERLGGARNLLTLGRAEFYYDLLAGMARRVELWETTYLHVMESRAAIIEFIRATGLRPFLEALADDGERAEFIALLDAAIAPDYPARADGRVLFPFRRLFFVAYR